MRIVLCTTVVPFERGGGELLADSLEAELCARGHQVARLALPFSWADRAAIVTGAVAWRLLDLRAADGAEPDLVIATRYPSYLVRHPRKVVWLVHQLRQAYDLDGTRWGFLGPGEDDRRLVAMVREMDGRALGEARRLLAIGGTVADRLRRYNGLEAAVVHPPSPLAGRLREGEPGDYVLAAGRLDPLKRLDLLLAALALTERPLRAVLAGAGPQRAELEQRVAALGLDGRVRFAGWVDEAELVELYAGCLAVFHAPWDEDYGFVTAEAFEAGKPVVTAADAGSVLELVTDGVTGLVAPRPEPAEIAGRLDRLDADRDLARRLGRAGRAAVRGIRWDTVLPRLLGSDGG